jgi:hypothetical protein
MKKNYMVPCVIGFAAALLIMAIVGVKASTLGFLAIVLLCPLMMFMMMRSMGGNNQSSGDRDQHTDTPSSHPSPR